MMTTNASTTGRAGTVTTTAITAGPAAADAWNVPGRPRFGSNRCPGQQACCRSLERGDDAVALLKRELVG